MPYSLHLVDVRFDKYIGTQTASNYSSDVRLVAFDGSVNRKVHIWMNNPLPFHQNAGPAAQAALEAYQQGGDAKFWQMHAKLFENQRALERADLERYAGVAPARPSYFELLTAAALLWFSNEAVDAAVVEVGLLGRYDATNVVDSAVSVITNIGRDHTDGTGNWRRDVSSEKAGIIRPGRPLVLGETSIELLDVFAAESPDPLLLQGTDFGVGGVEQAVGGQLLEVWTPSGWHEEVYLPMYGDHQADNAALALMAAEAFLDAPLGTEVVAEGLASVRVPGRLEVVATEPLVVLDGAHNQDAARALVAAVPTVFPTGRRILVVGTLGPREPAEFFDELVALGPDLVVACTAPSSRAVPAADLAALARERRMEVETVPDAVDAVRLAVATAEEADLILVTGSFYVLSAARTALGEEDIPDDDVFDS